MKLLYERENNVINVFNNLDLSPTAGTQGRRLSQHPVNSPSLSQLTDPSNMARNTGLRLISMNLWAWTSSCSAPRVKVTSQAI